MLIVDGTLVPTRDRSIAEQSKSYRYSTANQGVIDADTRAVVIVGRPVPGNRHDSRGREESGARATVGHTTTVADGGYQGTGLVIPHRRARGKGLPGLEGGTQPLTQASSGSRRTRLRLHEELGVLRDFRLKGNGVHCAVLGVARLHNLAPTG
ncbi:transposase [Kitasatospora sp. NPDC002965]|uniref:transposase n=1 Tax=Kitasatospora sp. NPDC002965 TaxID=3154775 RepID=UPI00339EAE05